MVGAFRHIKRDAVRQVIESPPVHVQDERRPLVPGVNTVYILWHEAHANAWPDGRATALPDLPLARYGIVAHLFVEPVLLGALDANDNGPRGVIMGRHVLGANRRAHVERKTVVVIFGQTINRIIALVVLLDDKILFWKQFRMGREFEHNGLDGFQGLAGHALVFLNCANTVDGGADHLVPSSLHCTCHNCIPSLQVHIVADYILHSIHCTGNV